MSDIDRKNVINYSAGGEQPVGLYLPNSNKDTVICEAYVDNFNSADPYNTWGYGVSPIRFGTMSGADPKTWYYKDDNENAVYIGIQEATETNRLRAHVDLGRDCSNKNSFTCYFIGKLHPSTTNSIPMFVGMYYESGNGPGNTLMVQRQPSTTTLWINNWNNNPVQLSSTISVNDYFAFCLQYRASETKGYACVTNKTTALTSFIAAPGTSNLGPFIGLGLYSGRQLSSSTTFDSRMPTNLLVKYFAVVNIQETETVCFNNMENLKSKFL